MNWTALGGRRFVLTLGCGIVCTALVYLGKIDGMVYRDIIIGTVGLYIGGNTWEAIKASKLTAEGGAP